MTTHHSSTLSQLFAERIVQSREQPALWRRQEAGFVATSWGQLASDVYAMTAQLQAAGVRPGDRVAHVSENRYEWIVLDLAILGARGVHVPIHSTLSGAQIAWQIENAGARLVAVSGNEHFQKLTAAFHSWPAGLTCWSYDRLTDGAQHVVLWDELLATADRGQGERAYEQAAAVTRPDDLATILYTSGTTGEPKGVMLSHGNLTSNALATVEAFDMAGGDVRLTWLPLSHIFARTCDLYAWIATGTQLALAQSRETILADCAVVRPTLLNGVPYFFEKVMRALMDSGRAETQGALRHLFGGRIRFCCSGGAALPNHVAQFFAERGVLLIQGYGLTECAPVMTMNTERAHRLGTVGQAPRGVEIRIAPDGEILTRGPHVMQGYWNKPEATAEAIREGWLHSGDLGSLDADGFLRITGRKKELIVTAGGKNVAPVYLESLLTEDPWIPQAMVVGDGRKCLAALIVANLAALRQAVPDLPAEDEAALEDPRVLAAYRQRIDQRLADVADFEQVAFFRLLRAPFSIEAGELTPTLKLRRSIVAQRYAALIERMYA